MHNSKNIPNNSHLFMQNIIYFVFGVWHEIWQVFVRLIASCFWNSSLSLSLCFVRLCFGDKFVFVWVFSYNVPWRTEKWIASEQNKKKINQFHAHWRPSFKVCAPLLLENNKRELIVEVMFYNEPACQSPCTVQFCCHWTLCFGVFFFSRLASEHQQVVLVEHETFLIVIDSSSI